MFSEQRGNGEWYRLTEKLAATIRRDGYWPLGATFDRKSLPVTHR